MQSSPFALLRATKDDLPELCSLMYQCFDGGAARIFMGCESEADLPKLVKMFEDEWDTDTSVVWLKVIETTTNKLVAAAQWKVHVSHALSMADNEPPSWLEGETKETASRLFAAINETRGKHMTGSHIYLHICYTDAAYRRRGAGGMMLKWGVDLADLLQIPGWIEASEDGNWLYKVYGFYDFEKVNYDGLPIVHMRRDAKTQPIMGGKIGSEGKSTETAV